MRQQQEAGVQASITRFAKPPKAEAADTTAQRGNKRHSDSMLLKVLGNSKLPNSKAAQQQRRVATPAPSDLVLLAVTASAPARAAQKARNAGRLLTEEVQSSIKKQQQLPTASTSTPCLPGARTAGSAASQSTANQPQSHSSTAVPDPPQHGQQARLQECPLCGEQVPARQLRQHVDAELAQLDLQETETAAAETVGTGRTTALWPEQQQEEQQYNHHSGRSNQQQQWPRQQQQQVSARWHEPVTQPTAKRPRPVQQQHQQEFAQQQPWQQQQQQQELAQQQPWQQQQPQQQSGAWHKRPPPQQHQHQQREQRQQHTWQEQQHRAQSWPPQQKQPKQRVSSTHSIRNTSSSSIRSAKCTGGVASSVSVPVRSLSAAPRRPVGPDGQPVTHVDGGFDHWGDSSLNYLDDSAIGIDGGLPSADAYWEGVGRCAMGPRTLR